MTAFQNGMAIQPNVAVNSARITSSSSVTPPARMMSSIMAAPASVVEATSAPYSQRRGRMRGSSIAAGGWPPAPGGSLGNMVGMPDIVPRFRHAPPAAVQVQAQRGRLPAVRDQAERGAPAARLRKGLDDEIGDLA